MLKNWRVGLIFLFILAGTAVIINRLVFIQITNRDYWKALAKGQQFFFDQVTGKRGEIFIRDKDGTLYKVATTKDLPVVCVSAEKIFSENENPEDIIKKLAEILVLQEEAIYEKIRNAVNLCEIIKEKLNEEETKRLVEADFPGVYLKKKTFRFYPQEKLLAHVLGFVGGEGTGQYGAEGYYEEVLRGSSGFEAGEKGPKIYLIKNSVAKGKDIILTIDYNIQFEAERLLESFKEELKMEAGTIIVGDPLTGKIFALANYPGFNPNEYGKEKDLAIFQNAAVQRTYEPGSVFKPVTMAAGLEAEKITPETSYTDEGTLVIGGHIITNYANRVWGKRTMIEVLERSINTGAVFAEKQAGDEQFLATVEKFGFFAPTGIGLQGETYSDNKTLRNGQEINFVTASFGQGLEVTPIQLFRAFSAIANGGKLIQPRIAEGPDSKEKNEIREVISAKTAGQLTAMLVSVVENGFGKAARIPGYYVAGKTGTAQVAWAALGIDKTGYSDKTIQTFIGFAPAYHPRFVILVKLDNPEAKTAEYSALPIFREMAKYLIDYWQIPPDYE